MKLTQKSVSALTLPPGKSEAIYFDDAVPGLGLRLRAGGAGRWIFQYRVGVRHRRITLGSVSAIPLAQARASAGKLHAGVKLGGDPAGAKAEERARAAETMGAILEPYLARQRARLRLRSLVEVERHLMKHCKPLHGLRLDKIDRRAVAARITAIASKSGAIAANRTRSSLAAFFVWAAREGLTDHNPVAGTNRQAERSRDRVLSLDEIKTIWSALGDDDYGTAVKLLILTGQRASEIGSLTWGEVVGDEIVLPPSRTKNKRRHIVPLVPAAQALLAMRPRGGDQDHVFSRRGGRPLKAWSSFKEALDKRLRASGVTLKGWCHHDLRRSTITHMVEIGVMPHVAEAIANHQSGQTAIARVYNRSTLEPQKRAALTLWSQRLLAHIEGRSATIVSLRA
jgi:integrase